MSMTLATLKSETRSLLNEPAQEFFDDTEIERWLQQAAIDVSRVALCVEGSAEVGLTTDTQEYSLTGTDAVDAIKIHAVIYDEKGLMKIDPRMIAHITGTASGTPAYWYDWGGSIGFWPVPDSDCNGTSADLYFSEETDDVTEIPDEFQLDLPLYAASRGKIKEGKFAQAAQLQQMYLNSVAFHRQNLHERGRDSKDMMKVPDRTVQAQ